MKVKFRVKSKKVLAIILVAITVFCSGFIRPTKTFAQESSNNNIRIEMTNQRKVIDVKRNNTGTSTNITVNGRTYKARKMQVKATAYAGHQLTSTGGYAKVNRTIAVDPRIIPYGSKIYIPELNYIGVAEDCGSAIKQNRIDIFMATESQCIQWGIRNITIYILE